MIILFVGAQGSGKGTQAKIISEKLKIAHISTGDLLREATGKLKKLADSYAKRGDLVPSEIVIEMLKKRIKEKDCKNSFILDGFPRNLEQAKQLEKIMKIDRIIEIFISDQEAAKRLKGRWNCKKCGIAYNIVTSPRPKHDKKCDVCGSSLYQREDDTNEETIQKRLDIYHRETEPMLKKYSNSVIKINGEQEIKKITEDILKELT